MMSSQRRGPWRPLVLCSIGLTFLALAIAGCRKAAPQVAPAETPAVPVANPVEREVTDFADFTGRTDAVHSVNIVPRVTGYLVQMPFKEGSEVKKNDLLFEIDPRPYQAQLDQAQAQVTLNEAQLNLAKSTLARYQELDRTTPGAVSKQELDQYKAAVVEAEARVAAAKKSLEVFQLNLEFTKVKSPIDGQVSRYYLTLGNLVNQDQTLLTTVVTLDPMYAYFDMDERTLIQIRKAIVAGQIMPFTPFGDIPVSMALPGETDYPHKGTINFINNQVNSGTGSISMRGVFENPRVSSPANGSSGNALTGNGSSTPPPPPRRTVGTGRLLSPGMFVRVRLPIGKPHQALLVIDRAIQSDQGLKYVFVIGADGKAEYRRVTTGALQPDGLRVVDPYKVNPPGPDGKRTVEGLKKDDLVLVGALQQIRARMDVKPEKREMPRITSTADEEAAPPEAQPGRGQGKPGGAKQGDKGGQPPQK
jgi:multidrug efflux system membrane fusion protein